MLPSYLLFLACVGAFDAVSVHAQLPPWSAIAHGKTTRSNLRLQQEVLQEVERRGEAGGKDETTTTPVARGTLRVSGACAAQPGVNADFWVRGATADNKPYYQNEDGTVYLYFDKDCNGKGGAPAGWIFDGSEPSITAASDLDGDGDCAFNGYLTSGSLLPPKEAVWKLSCADGFTDVSLSITDDRVCPKGSFCKGDGCNTDTMDTPTRRDRWNPEEVCSGLSLVSAQREKVYRVESTSILSYFTQSVVKLH